MNDGDLSQIETAWSVIRRAHDDRSGVVRQAQQQMLDRYGGAIERYLIAATRDPDAAADIYQEFSLKFLAGKLGDANPERGRFRNFLRTILFRMVADHHRQRRRSPLKQVPDQEIAVEAETDKEETFYRTWRMALLTRAWDRLHQAETETGRPLFAVLRAKTDHPKLDSAEIARRLTDQLGRKISSGNLRVMLHRSRENFGDLLLDEVAQTLESADYETIEAELIDLQLLEYCRPALQRYGQRLDQ